MKTSGPNWPDSFKIHVRPSSQCQHQALNNTYSKLIRISSVNEERFQGNEAEVDQQTYDKSLVVTAGAVQVASSLHYEHIL